MPEKNTGISYETLTMAFFQAILDQDVVKNIKVQHNVSLPGRSGNSHQIDVYWEFEVGGVRYQTVVQCKDWNSRVKQEQVLAFSAVLDELPGQPRGIIVTKMGYQSGAETLAKSKGIALYVLKEADDEFWAGKIKTVVLGMELYAPRIEDVQLGFDTPWVAEEMKKAGLSGPIPIHMTAGEATLVHDSGTAAGTIAELMQSYIPDGYNVLPPDRKTVKFDKPTYIVAPELSFGRIKVNEISFTVAVVLLKEKITIEGSDAIKFVLQTFDGLQVATADGKLKVTRTGSP